jgi:hypothetical protein
MDIVNLYALRSTDPGLLLTASELGDDERNDWAILKTCQAADLVIVGWGVWGRHHGRGEAVATMLDYHGIDVFCLGVTAEGYPRHPLYIKKDEEPRPWESKT